MRKRWLTLAAIAVATVLLASLFAVLRGGSASAAPKAGFSACLVTDIGGLNDHGFNHLAYQGLLKAEKAGVTGTVLQSKSAQDYIPNFQACHAEGRRDHDRHRLQHGGRDGSDRDRRIRTTSSRSSTTTSRR